MSKIIQFLDTTPPRRTFAVVTIWGALTASTVIGTALIVNYLIGG